MHIVEPFRRKSRTFLPSSRTAKILSASETDKPTLQACYKQSSYITADTKKSLCYHARVPGTYVKILHSRVEVLLR
jgi:hypothetical protein